MPEDFNGFIVNPIQYSPKTGTQLLHEEIAALRGQVAQLADANMQLAQRVEVLEAAQRPRATSVVSTVDWEDNL